MTSCWRSFPVVVAGLLLLAPAYAARAQSDLRCYKVKDPLKLKGTVDFESLQLGLAEGCSLKKGAFLCVPGTTTVSEAMSGKDPVSLLPVTGSDLTDNRICYKLKCADAPAPQAATDLFGARTLEPKSTGLLCTSALPGLVDPDCTTDAHCDDDDPCNGFESCTGYQCQPGTPIGCQAGDLVFLVPFEEDPSPPARDVEATPALQSIDVYLLLDRSGSMLTEISTIRTNAAAVLNDLRCPPFGSGSPGSCIPDLWGGAGTIGYTGGSPYTNHLSLQPNPNFSGIPTTEPGGCCNEPTLLGAWTVMSGLGSVAASNEFDAACNISVAIPNAGSCATSPAVVAGYGATGYPCFRSSALPALVIATDEAPSQTLSCPTIADVVAEASASSTRILGLLGSGATAQTQPDLEALASQSGAVDAANTPLVFQGADANADDALQAAIATLYAAPLDTRAVAVDDTSDAVDAVSAFVQSIATLQLGTTACPAGLTEQDSDGDTIADEYAALPRGNAACWRVSAKPNTTVAATAEPQVFEAQVSIEGGRRADMGHAQRLLFVVPPTP